VSVGCEKSSVVVELILGFRLLRLVNICNKCHRFTIMFCRAILRVPDCVAVRVPMVNGESSQWDEAAQQAELSWNPKAHSQVLTGATP